MDMLKYQRIITSLEATAKQHNKDLRGSLHGVIGEQNMRMRLRWEVDRIESVEIEQKVQEKIDTFQRELEKMTAQLRSDLKMCRCVLEIEQPRVAFVRQDVVPKGEVTGFWAAVKEVFDAEQLKWEEFVTHFALKRRNVSESKIFDADVLLRWVLNHC